MTRNWTPHEWMLNGSRLIAEDPTKGQDWLKKGLKSIPSHSEALFNLGLALHINRKIDEAIRAYRLALKYSNEENISATKNLAQDLLLNGEFEEGWEMYENRLKESRNSFEVYEKRYGRAWNGLEDNRTTNHLMIIAEQGYGDTIQFCRLILVLQKKGIKTSFFCQDALSNLLKNSTQIRNVKTALTDSTSSSTRWCPLLSLPMHLGIDNTNIPFNSGYIEVDKERRKLWEILLQKKPRKILVGIHWQGNPDFEKRLYSRGRSMKAENFNVLKGLKNIQYVSLQKGNARNDVKNISELNFVEGQDKFDATLNFEDTAAVLANCDLLISTDSSVVHLAGAMNIPTFVLLSWVPEWRWGLHGKKTNWYKSTRLYRQQKQNDWLAVMEEIRIDLKEITNVL